MKYNELSLNKQKTARRAGRGISAGRGKTAGRGTKGQGARKSPTRVGFEGGQTPLAMRLPKMPGFKSLSKKAENVNTGQLNGIKASVIDSTVLFEAGLISSPYAKIKILSGGNALNTKKTVKLPAASTQAINNIKKAGGVFEQVDRLARPAKQQPKD